MEDMKRLITAAGSDYEGRVWIGHYDNYGAWALTESGFYKHGEWDFRKWAKGQPNNTRMNPQLCVSIKNGVWYDHLCHIKFTFVCYNRKLPHLPSNSIKRYFYINQVKTWSKAASYCRHHHTNLASVRNDDENRMIQQKVPDNQMVMIGLYSKPWSWWSDHSTFKNWADGHPSNRGASCAASVINATHLGKWVDYDCSNKFSFMCHNNKRQVFSFKLTALKSTVDLKYLPQRREESRYSVDGPLMFYPVY